MKKRKQNTIVSLGTERRNPRTVALDTKTAIEIARIINREDAKVAAAVRKALPRVASAIELVADALRQGGRLIYVGAGTSGRIAALDAAECPPTFNTKPESILVVMAGGSRALGAASEGSEDSAEQGAADIAKTRPSRRDIVAGLAASGRTPYTIAALEYAKERGAKTIAIVCNRGSRLGQVADVEIVAEPGAEVVSGSTRMKAATAQKMICNMLTTGAMARLGYVFGNQMVNVSLKNEKLVERGIQIVQATAGVDRATAINTLKASNRSVAVALVMLLRKVTATEAHQLLKSTGGHVRRAIQGA